MDFVCSCIESNSGLKSGVSKSNLIQSKCLEKISFEAAFNVQLVHTPIKLHRLPRYNNEYFMKKQQAILCFTENLKKTFNYLNLFLRSLFFASSLFK